MLHLLSQIIRLRELPERASELARSSLDLLAAEREVLRLGAHEGIRQSFNMLICAALLIAFLFAGIVGGMGGIILLASVFISKVWGAVVALVCAALCGYAAFRLLLILSCRRRELLSVVDKISTS